MGTDTHLDCACSFRFHMPKASSIERPAVKATHASKKFTTARTAKNTATAPHSTHFFIDWAPCASARAKGKSAAERTATLFIAPTVLKLVTFAKVAGIKNTPYACKRANSPATAPETKSKNKGFASWTTRSTLFMTTTDKSAKNAMVRKLSVTFSGNPQKLPYFHKENRVETPAAPTTKAIGKYSQVTRTDISPCCTALPNQVRRLRNTNTASTTCFWYTSASWVKGKNHRGINKRTRYKLTLRTPSTRRAGCSIVGILVNYE